jgi:hypothetical protein
MLLLLLLLLFDVFFFIGLTTIIARSARWAKTDIMTVSIE